MVVLRVAVTLLLCATALAGCRRAPAPAPTPDRSSPDAAAPLLEHRQEGLRFWLPADEPAAVREVLKPSPLLLGIGEFHQKKSSARVASALRRFSGSLLGALAAVSSDLIVETWMTEGRCGEQEARVSKQVEAVTERPAATENEVVGLLRRAKGLGLQPHILTVSCQDYRRLLGAGAKVDYEELLALVTRQLTRTAERVWQRRQSGSASQSGPAAGSGRVAARRLILLYGGALHNDRFPPHQELQPYSYAGALEKLSGDRFVELDLYVPEYIDGDKGLLEQAWYPIFKRHGGAGLLLIERGPRSYILIFPRGGPS